MKIQEIKEQFKNCPTDLLPQLIETYGHDERSGIRAEIARAVKRLEAVEKEKERMFTMLRFEREYAYAGYLCGIDEVGRGCLYYFSHILYTSITLLFIKSLPIQ